MSDTYTDFAPLKYDQAEINRQGWGTAAAGATDDKLIVGFYRKSILNAARSREAGKRICEDRDFVKIQHPGESLNIVDRPVQESDKQRWPRQWGQFASNQKQIPDGIPITLLFPAQPSITDMLTGYNIHTVEQLSGLSAHGIQTVGMGAQDWVNKAKKYLEQAEKGVDFHRFNTEIDKLTQENSTLKRQLSELSAQVARLANVRPAEPRNADFQSMQTAAVMRERAQPTGDTVTFSQDIGPATPDLSGETIQPPKRPGRPLGSKNRPKEN